MKVIVHIEPIFDEEWSKKHRVRSLNYSIKKKNECWWTNYTIDYIIKLNRITKKERDFLDFVIEDIYKVTHNINELKKEKKFGEFIHNIIADLESNIKFQPTDVLYADMAGKLSAYKYIKKNFLEA